MISEVRGEKAGEKTGDKRYGLVEPEERSAKRARVEDDSD
jgi:SNW domain-containing protein 1